MVNNVQYIILFLLGIVTLLLLLKNNFLFFFVAIELLFLTINLQWILYSLIINEISGAAIALILIALAAVDAAIGLSLLLKYFSLSLTGKIQLSEMKNLKG